MMHKVFGSAKEVIVDLGHAYRFSHMLPSSDDDFERLGIESMESGNGDTLGIMLGVSDVLDSEQKDVSDHLRSEIPVQMWLAIGKLFQREWVSDLHNLIPINDWCILQLESSRT